jgi:hypothetical protein
MSEEEEELSNSSDEETSLASSVTNFPSPESRSTVVLEEIRDISVKTVRSADSARSERNRALIQSPDLDINRLRILEDRLRRTTSTYLDRNFRNEIANLVSDSIKLIKLLKKINLASAIQEMKCTIDEKDLFRRSLEEITAAATDHIVMSLAEDDIDLENI